MKIFSWVILILKGAAVGTGAILPGVSGGVLCLAFGIYEPMMALLSHPVKAFKLYYKMLIPFLIGWGAGFLLLARVVELIFEAFPSAALALFTGLVLGSVPDMLAKTIEKDSKQNWSPLIISLTAAFAFLSFLKTESFGQVSPSVLWYVFCGSVWGLSLVIPGLSSSSILIYMGLYQPMTSGIARFDLSIIIPLLVGLALTVLLSARFINRLFEKKYALISRITIGVMLASTLLIIPSSFAGIPEALSAIACFAAGFITARMMDIKAKNSMNID